MNNREEAVNAAAAVIQRHEQLRYDNREVSVFIGGQACRQFAEYLADAGLLHDQQSWDDMRASQQDIRATMQVHIDRAEQALAEVLLLHSPARRRGQGYLGDKYTDIVPCCAACGTSDEYAVPWPCATYKAATAWRDKGFEGEPDYDKARKAAQRADMDAEYDDTNPAGW